MDSEGREVASTDALTHPKYRADIDGLRAVAVLSVLGFHAYPEWIHGGFIGVDIFFVISGFLISTIIFQGLAASQFSFGDFYSRRIRRIFPALTTVLIFALVVGWFVLYPDEYRQLGKHVVGGAGFISNFVLWRESGYFDSAAEVKPLLHLWSLAIEEQYYIVFPLLVWLAWKKRFNLFTVIALLATISYALNIAYIRKDAVWTFYQPQTRIWELMVGALLALLVLDHSGRAKKVQASLAGLRTRVVYRHDAPAQPADVLSNAKAWLGAFFLTVAMSRITRESHFPGSWALAPTLGAALLIWAGPQAWLNRVVLANSLMVWVGKISYPLYLWHWVILVYLRILASETPSVTVRTGGLLVAFAFSWLTYRFIETPLRFGGNTKRKTVGLIALMLVIAGIALACYRTEGFAKIRPNLGMASSEQFAWKYLGNAECAAKVRTQAGFCMQLGNAQAISIGVIGDSTANALVPGVADLVMAKNEGMINIGHGACPPVRGLVPTATWGAKPNCPEIVDDAYRVVMADRNIKTVIMGVFTHDMQDWGYKDLPANASVTERFAKAMVLMDKDIAALQANGKRVILTYDAAYSPVSAKDCVYRPYSSLLRAARNCDVTEAMIIDRYPYLALFNEHFKGRNDVCVLHQSDILFTNGKLNLVDADGNAMLRDTHHLSVFGSKKMAQYLATSACKDYLPWKTAGK